MSVVARSFYVPLGGGRFRSTELTAGPWSADAQHGGPPAALLARTIEAEALAEVGDRASPEANAGIFVRLTFEILGPIPVGKLSVHTKTVRPGRRISLHEAVLTDEQARPVMLCRAWRISTTGELSLPRELKATDAALHSNLPGPEEGREEPFFEAAPEVGYHHAIEARFVKGSWREPGPAAAWIRSRVPLLPEEKPSPLGRVLVAADSGNGVGGALDTSAWMFVNPETTVHLHAYPRGEWVGLESSAAVEAHGVVLTSTTIHDEEGQIGSAAQTLLVARR